MMSCAVIFNSNHQMGITFYHPLEGQTHSQSLKCLDCIRQMQLQFFLVYQLGYKSFTWVLLSVRPSQPTALLNLSNAEVRTGYDILSTVMHNQEMILHV